MQRTDSSNSVHQNPRCALCSDWQRIAQGSIIIALIIINALAINGSMSSWDLGCTNIGLIGGFTFVSLSETRKEYSKIKAELSDEELLAEEPYSGPIDNMTRIRKNNIVKVAALSLFITTLIMAINGGGPANLLSAETLGQATLSLSIIGAGVVLSYAHWLENRSKKHQSTSPALTGDFPAEGQDALSDPSQQL